MSLLDDPAFVTELDTFESAVDAGIFDGEVLSLGDIPDTDTNDDADDDQPACFLVPGYRQPARRYDPPIAYVAFMMLIGAGAAALMFHRELLLLF